MIDPTDPTKPIGHMGSWQIAPGGRVDCTPVKDTDCWYVPPIQTPSKPLPFHDEILMQLTTRINELLQDVVDCNKDPEKKLSLINTSEGLMFVWVTEKEIVTRKSDPEIQKRALGL